MDLVIKSASRRPESPDSYFPRKGDVCLVPWRKEYWPSLIKNAYPKKITYTFFPLPEDGKSTIFTYGQPKKCKKLAIFDKPPSTATEAYKDALNAAKEYISFYDEMQGWNCHKYDPLDALNTGMKRTHVFETDESSNVDNDNETESAESDVEDEEKQEAFNKDENENDQPDEIDEPKVKRKSVAGNSVRSTNGNTKCMDDSNGAPYPFSSEYPLKHTPGIPLNVIIFENIDKFLTEVWESPCVRSYTVPERGEISFKLPYAKILNGNDADLLFEHCFNFVKEHEPECRTLPAIDLVATVLFPEVVVRSIMVDRNCSHPDAVNYMISKTRAGFYNSDDASNAGLQVLMKAVDAAAGLQSITEAASQ